MDKPLVNSKKNKYYAFISLKIELVFHQIYPNFSIPRGVALVINNVKFHREEDRDGSMVDRENVRTLLDELGYIVTVKDNLTARVS